MGTIWVREFKGGLDTRRQPETTSGGVLIRAANGHITRGGDFEKRAAFVPAFTLPAGTIGIASTPAGLFVFGSGATPAGLPASLTYQRLQHPDGVTTLARLLSYDLYAGKIYAVGEFADGGRFHFYDGVRVTDWYDGRARATFSVTEGSVTPAVPASGSFEVLTGTLDAANTITSIKIDGVELLSSTVAHTGNNATTAAALAANIQAHSSTPEYNAVSDGQTVTITTAVAGPEANGKALVVAVTGDATVGNLTTMGGGAANIAATLLDIKVDGVSIIAAPIAWASSNEATAGAIASAIGSHASVPDYTATVLGDSVSIAAADAGAEPNDFSVTFVTLGNFGVDPGTGLVLSSGADTSASFQPGPFVKTVGSKVFSVSGPNMHFSGIKAPTKFTTDAVGAGFIDLSSEASGTENLVALARYQSFVAVFAERIIQVWALDPDPALNRELQTLNNTGTISAKSVTEFGDNDLFYVDESGVRSLRARDSSNSASTNDVGVFIDTLITEKLGALTAAEREAITGVIEPLNGRFWLSLKDTIFVFSLFTGVQISAWTTYEASAFDEAGVKYTFDIEHMLVHDRRVYIRSGDTIYVYGGLGSSLTYDATIAEAWLPYFDANDPTRLKSWEGVDCAVEGEWSVSLAMQPTQEAAEDTSAVRVWQTTYNGDRLPLTGGSTHASLRFRSEGAGAAKISSAVLHYTGDEDAD